MTLTASDWTPGFARTLLATLPPLRQIEAECGGDYPRLAGKLAAYYFSARCALEQIATDPEEDDEEDDEFEHGDPIAALEVPPLEEVDYGAMPVAATDKTLHDWEEITR